jgi:hypothetical protein
MVGEPAAGFQQALARLVGGDIKGGLAHYARGLRRKTGPRPPVGSHIAFLERARSAPAAAALRQVALRRGLDIAAADASAEDYEALFRRGFGNAPMVCAYLSALAALGREEAIAAIVDVPRLLRRVRLDLRAPDGRELAPAVQRGLIEREEEGTYQESVQSIRKMRKLDQLQRIDEPAFAALAVALRREAQAYLADWAESDHVLAPLVARRFRLKAWGLISRGEGFNVPHIHHKGWATGIYYPVAAPEGGGGELRIGPPPGLAGSGGWPDVTIRPEPGLLVLIPSYYTHWTLPLSGPGVRTSVAFDLIPSGSAGASA